MARQYPSGFFIVTNETATSQYPQGGMAVADTTTSTGTTVALPAATATAQTGTAVPTVLPTVSAVTATAQAAATPCCVAVSLAAATGNGTVGQLGLPAASSGAFAGGTRVRQRFPDFWLPKRKPVGDVEIDRANRLVSRGLAAFWAAGLNQDATGIRDLMNYGPTLTATGTAATIGVTASGQIGAVTGSTNYFSAAYSTNYLNLSPTSTLTLVLRACFSAAPQFQDIFALNLNADPFDAWGIISNGSNFLSATYNTGGAGTNHQVNDGTVFSPVVGQMYSIAMVLDGTNCTLYLDGAVKAQAAQVSGNITYPTGAGPFFNSGNYITSPVTTQLDYAAFWPTALTQAEIASLVHDPYQMLRPVAKRQYVTNTSSNATVALPAATASAQAASAGVQVTVQAAAVNGTAQPGSLTKTVSLTPAATTATGQPGAVTINVSATVALPAASATGQAGSVVKTVSVTPAAATGTGQAGTLAKTVQFQSPAATATAQPGTITPVPGQVINLPAVIATGNAGLFGFAFSSVPQAATVSATAGSFTVKIVNPHPVDVAASIDAVLLSTRGAPPSRTAFIE